MRLLLAMVFVIGCDADFPIGAGAGLTPVTIGELVASTPGPDDPDGQAVLIHSAVIVAQDTFDEVGNGRVGTIFLVDAGNEPGHGFQAFAPQVNLSEVETLDPGNLVDVTGTFVRFLGPRCDTMPNQCFTGGRTLPQLGMGAVVELVGFWQAPVALEVSLDAYRRNAALYVGSLITLTDLEANEDYQPASGGTRLAPFSTVQGVNVAADLYRIPGVAQGVRIRRLTGIASFFYSDFVMPRSAADVELAP